MKKCLSVLLVMMLLLICVLLGAVSISAETKYYTQGDYKYTVNNGKATITSYTGSETNLTIPSKLGGYPVIGISGYCEPYGSGYIMSGCFNSSLVSVTLPKSITTIDNAAFSGCEKLISVTIPNSVVTIGKYAFYGCDSLTTVTIPDSVTTLDRGAFADCDSLTTVTIGDGVATIGDYVFSHCHRLTSVTIPDSVKTIGNSAFYYCESLTSVTIGNGVTAIGEGVFSECYNMTSMTIPFVGSGDKNNTHFGYLFGLSLKNENIPSSLKTVVITGGSSIDDYAFYDCNIAKITLPNSIKSIGDYAFWSCGSLTSITIPDSVTSIGDEAFYDCYSLSSVTIGNGVTTIGDKAFSICRTLTSVSLGDRVKTIGDGAFFYCNNLTSISVSKNNAYYCSQDGVLFNKKKTTLVQYPYKKGGAYTIPNGVTSIDFRTFYECKNLTSVTIPESVTAIGDYAFYSCDALTNVTIPDSVKTIGDKAFYGCDVLTAVTMGKGVTTIGDEAFYYCVALANVTIGEGVTDIGDRAFYDCDALTTVTIPDKVVTIGDEAFCNCLALRWVNIGKSVATVGKAAFASCSRLTAFTVVSENANLCSEDGVLFTKGKTAIIRYPSRKEGSYTIPNSVTVIGDYAFQWCDITDITIPKSVKTIGNYAFCEANLTSLIIPNGVTTIGESAFAYCSKITNVTIPKSVTTIGKAAFVGQTLITVDSNNAHFSSQNGVLFNKDKSVLIQYPGSKDGDYTIPNSVITIGNSAFYYCESLTSVTIPNSVTTIGDYAFYKCYGLTAVVIPDSVTTIGDYAFDYCRGLCDVYYAGDEVDRFKISLGNENGRLLNATWHYNSCIGKEKHTYTNACDASCNTCGATRTAPHTYEDATCTKAKICTACGATSGKALGHKYTNACDTSCNVCKATRTITHDYADATCTKAKTCTVCGATSGKALGHKYTNACDTSCNTCKATRSAPHSYKTVTKKATTSANGYTVKRCSLCNKETGKKTLYKVSSITLSKTSYTYDGKVKKPTVTVKNANGVKLTEGTSYTVTYASGRKAAGTYKVTIKLKGNYSGTVTKTFKINPIDVSKCKVSLSATSYTYDGKVKKPTVMVKNAAGTKLTLNGSYTVTYASGRKNVGTYKVTIKMKGNYTGTKTLTFKILPAKTSISKLTAGSKKLTVKWAKKTTQVTGYEIQYSTSKSFSSAKTKTITKNSTVSTTLTGLSAKKTYYVRVRTYKTVNGKKVYSGWSTVKSLKTK